ncbi:recombinase family protein [Halobacillus litoralis]|uniref:recombinase family protein n=1 Tax=Halobacillus litoralis TaxID=45668 RepID=UPI001CFF3B29|nr:recombinase family protein [Halobacillus litoralis]
MERVFCYYKKDLNMDHLSSPVERIINQDKILFKYCEDNNLHVVKRFSDLGYLGSHFQRPELIEMKKTLEKRDCQVSTLIFYSMMAVKNENKVNEKMLLEIVKVIGRVYFYKQDMTLDYERFHSLVKGPIPMHIKQETLDEVPAHSFDRQEEA